MSTLPHMTDSDKSRFPVVLISFFDYDFGTRAISGYLKTQGYNPVLVFFKHRRQNNERFLNDYLTTAHLDQECCLEEDIELLRQRIRSIRPRVIGLSLTSVTYQIARRITALLRTDSDACIVWGGVHPTLCPEECLDHTDAVCVGEGEYPFGELVESVFHQRPYSGIQNLWVKTNGEVHKNGLRNLISPLETLPYPDFEDDGNKFLIDSNRVIRDPAVTSIFAQGVYPIMASRGCLFDCAYCSNPALKALFTGKGAYFRRRSVDHVINELTGAVRHGPYFLIRFWDDIFTYDEAWIDEFCHKYLQAVGKPFACYAHPRQLHGPIIQKLIRAGVAYIYVGIQSGSQRCARQCYGRTQSRQDLIEASKAIQKSGAAIIYDLIADNPYEEGDDFKETVELLLSLPRPYQIRISSLCFFPKTTLTRRAIAEKVIAPLEQEQYTAKGLRNFYLHIPFIKGKDRYFWHVLIAMACHPYFPAFFVRWCADTFFLRRYPRRLFFAAKSYVRGISLLKAVANIAGSLVFQRPNSRQGLHEYSFARKQSLSFGMRNPSVFVKPPVEMILYRARQHQSGLFFVLKINNSSDILKYLQVTFMLYPAHRRYSILARWQARIQVTLGTTLADITVDHPRLSIETQGGHKQVARCLFYTADDILTDGILYVLSVSGRVTGRPGIQAGNRIIFYHQ